MASVAERSCAAVIGAAVADAAGQPIHWNYNQEKLDKILHQYGDPEFVDPSQNPFYNIKTGMQTCYGDQAYAVLKSLLLGNGFNNGCLIKTMNETLGAGSEYEKEPVNSYNFDKTTQTVSLPINVPWRNASIKDFLKNHDKGESDTGSENDAQIDSVTRIAPIVALYAGKRDMLSKVEEMVRVTQNNDIPVAFALVAARILEYYILNGSKTDVVEQVIRDLKDPQRLNPTDLDLSIATHCRKVLDARSIDHKTAVAQFALPGAFQSALHGLLCATDFVEGVRTTLRAGGCNASRAAFIGMCMAAQLGMESIPESWKSRTIRYAEIKDSCEQLMKMRDT